MSGQPTLNEVGGCCKTGNSERVLLVPLKLTHKPVSRLLHILRFATTARQRCCRATTLGLEQLGKGVTGELTALIRIHDVRYSITVHGIFDGFKAELHIHRVGEPPGQHLPRPPDTQIPWEYRLRPWPTLDWHGSPPGVANSGPPSDTVISRSLVREHSKGLRLRPAIDQQITISL